MATQPNKVLICPVCNKKFSPNGTVRRMCSPECARIMERELENMRRRQRNPRHTVAITEKQTWQRECPVCHKKFTAKRWNEVYCTRDCKRKQRRIYAAAQKQAIRDMEMAEAVQKVADERLKTWEALVFFALWQAQCIADLEAQLEEERKKPVPAPEPDTVGGVLLLRECKRLNLRASSLPCGDREECFLPDKCKDCPAGKTIKQAQLAQLALRRQPRHTGSMYEDRWRYNFEDY